MGQGPEVGQGYGHTLDTSSNDTISKTSCTNSTKPSSKVTMPGTTVVLPTTEPGNPCTPTTDPQTCPPTATAATGPPTTANPTRESLQPTLQHAKWLHPHRLPGKWAPPKPTPQQHKPKWL